MTCAEIRYVASQSEKFETILEFGAGRSTLIWAKHFRYVISVECRLGWYLDVQTWLARKKFKNVKMVFSPPESCAFGTDGSEVWNCRNPSDYGQKNEFAQYIRIAEELITSLPRPSVIFVDANMRSEILEIALRSGIKHHVLVHDVIPERRYLNTWEEDEQYKVLMSLDTLRLVTFNK
jgi:hypothetical protein